MQLVFCELHALLSTFLEYLYIFFTKISLKLQELYLYLAINSSYSSYEIENVDFIVQGYLRAVKI